jgi:hypothetical protein
MIIFIWTIFLISTISIIIPIVKRKKEIPLIYPIIFGAYFYWLSLHYFQNNYILDRQLELKAKHELIKGK